MADVRLAVYTDLEAEKEAREAADAAVSAEMESVSGAAQTGIAAEARAREASDNELRAEIENVSETANADISAEAQAREAADAALSTTIEGLSEATEAAQLRAETANELALEMFRSVRNMVVDTMSDLEQLSSEAYDGMAVYVVEVEKLYRFSDGAWKEDNTIVYTDGLPSAKKEYSDYTVPRFTAIERCEASVVTDGDVRYERIASASNTGNKYGYARFDIPLAADADKVIIDMTVKIPDTRYLIGIGDMSQRPGTSNKATYDKTGCAVYFGTKDGTSFIVNGSARNAARTAIGAWADIHIELNVKQKWMWYSISKDGVVLYRTVKEYFADTNVSSVTGIDAYTWTETAVEFGDVSVTALYGARENILYAVSTTDPTRFEIYAYRNNEPVLLGSRNIAIGKGFTVLDIDTEEDTYTLDSTDGITAGMTYSVSLSSTYYCAGKITAVNGNIITVDNMKYNTLNTGEDAVNYLTIFGRPDLGTIDITHGTAYAFGENAIAQDRASFAEGRDTIAVSQYAHAEGYKSVAAGQFGHAEGRGTSAVGQASHAEGGDTRASDENAHSEGHATSASGYSSHAEGGETIASDYYAHSEGYATVASGYGSHAEGGETKVHNDYAHAEGRGTTTSGYCSHAEGDKTTAYGDESHAEGTSDHSLSEFQAIQNNINDVIAAANRSTRSGSDDEVIDWFISYWDETDENGDAIHKFSLAAGQFSRVGGANGLALAKGSHAEGNGCVAAGKSSHAEGTGSKAIGHYSHAGGLESVASGQGSFAHGQRVKATNKNAIAIGYNNKEFDNANATGEYAITLGFEDQAIADHSVAIGRCNIASAENQTVVGKYSATQNNGLFVVGNGGGKNSRRNAFYVGTDNKAYVSGTVSDSDDEKALINLKYINEKVLNTKILRTSTEVDNAVAGGFYRVGFSYDLGNGDSNWGELLSIPYVSTDSAGTHYGAQVFFATGDETGKNCFWYRTCNGKKNGYHQWNPWIKVDPLALTTTGVESVVLKSSTPGSNKKFRLTVNDSGVIETTPVV